ncbi:MAG: RICIN domain-containing protein [Pseudonocardiales bacterium]
MSESSTIAAPGAGAEDVAGSRGARWANRLTRMTLLAVAGGLVVAAVGLLLLLSPEAEVSTPLVALHSGKCVSITGDVMADGVKVQQHTCTGVPGRTWRLESVGEGLADWAVFRIVGVDSGRCLTFSEERFGGAQVIVQQTCDPASDAQEWRFIIEEQRNGSSYGQLINMRSSTCLDINGGSVDVDTPVVLWMCGDQRNQRFGVADEAVLTVRGLRDALEAFAQRAVLDAHYRSHPGARPDLAEIAHSGAGQRSCPGSPRSGAPQASASARGG